MTEADERALSLLRRYGSARSTTRGYWSCGPERIAQSTVKRLLRQGLAYRDPENPVARVLVVGGRDDEPAEEEQEESLRWEVGPPPAADEDEEFVLPDDRGEDGTPVEVDQLIRED